MMKKIKVVAAALIQNNRVLVALRGPQMSTPNLWELPGGKVEAGESDEEALRRECAEELGISISVGGFLAASKVQADQRIIEMKVYEAAILQGTPQKTEHAELRWIQKDEIYLLQWAPADIDILPALIERL